MTKILKKTINEQATLATTSYNKYFFTDNKNKQQTKTKLCNNTIRARANFKINK